MSKELNEAGPSRPKLNDDNWRGTDDEVLHLLEIPYDSEDELGELLDEDDLTVDQIFDKFDEILGVVSELNHNTDEDPDDPAPMGEPIIESEQPQSAKPDSPQVSVDARTNDILRTISDFNQNRPTDEDDPDDPAPMGEPIVESNQPRSAKPETPQVRVNARPIAKKKPTNKSKKKSITKPIIESEQLQTDKPDSPHVRANSRSIAKRKSSNKSNKENLAKRPKKKKKDRPTLIWEHTNKIYDNEVFDKELVLPSELSESSSPFQLFKYFFNNSILEKIVYESNLYAVQKNPARNLVITLRDIEKYIGIIVMSSVLHCTSVRDMWHPILGNDVVKNCMSVNKFESLRGMMHFNDNTNMKAPNDPERDRLFKVRPVVDHLNERFSSIPMRPSLSVDEQVCATKTRHYMRQYNPRKPHKWGYKLYVLCDDKGFSYRFEIYSGQKYGLEGNEPHLGEIGNVVVRLTRQVPRFENYTVFCDNFYSSLKLFAYLSNQGIHALGTFRPDRIPDSPFPEKKELAQEPRGTSDEYVTKVDGCTISMVKWNDNDVVTIGSTMCGVLPLETIQRYNKKDKRFVEVPCPQIVKVYNKHMGGVDLMDSHIGRHHIRLKSRKWYFRMFYHLLDMAIVNAWIIHTSIAEKSAKMTQKQFRIDLAQTLCQLGAKENPKRGRPFSSAPSPRPVKKSAVARPPQAVCKDKTDHWPIWDGKRNRCKLENCKGNTNVKCSKCNLSLCFHATKNCFARFHE